MFCALATAPQLTDRVTPKLLDGFDESTGSTSDALSVEENAFADTTAAATDMEQTDADTNAGADVQSACSMELSVSVNEVDAALDGSFMQRIVLNDSSLWKGTQTIEIETKLLQHCPESYLL